MDMRSATPSPVGRPPITRWRRAPTARWPPGCSQRRPPALRACPAAHQRVLALTAQDRRHTIRPAMPLPRAPGRGCHGRTQPGTRRMTRPPALVAEPRVVAWRLASWNPSECAWTYSAPFAVFHSRFPEPGGQKRVLPNRSKADYATKASRVVQAARSKREAREPVVLRVSRLPFLPAGSPAFLERRGLPRELSAVSTRGQADAQRGQSVGSTVSSECRRSTGLPGGKHDCQCVY